jgi:glutathione S-transferase
MSQPDITLYTRGTPNGFKVSIVLDELAVPYLSRLISRRMYVHRYLRGRLLTSMGEKKLWFLELNPNGRVPALGQRVFESGAIRMYLVDKYDKEWKLSYEPGTPEYYEQLSWVMFHMSGVAVLHGWEVP